MASTKWTCWADPDGKANLMCEMDDPPKPKVKFPVKLRGVCYSPAPMNASNKEAPALGDWYWDSFKAGPDTISGWQDLWARDWGGLEALGAMHLRVYCMLSRQLNGPDKDKIPDPWDNGHLFTHNNFLDKCWAQGVPESVRKIKYVLVGLPVPATMLWKNQYATLPQKTITFWTEVVRETARTLGKHPAVMGFTLHNEQDGADVCYLKPDLADFWWGQTDKLAMIVKQEAPDKLVGMATHDDPRIPELAGQKWMTRCPHIDFWGVNTYQTVNFDGVFGPYSKQYPGALKPVILTEYGIPATSRRNASDPGSIYDDATTCQKTAAVISRVAPQAYTHPLSLGLYYFEYCDEWWNQPEAPNIYTWWSGPPNAGFPNGYWDNDGFGLHSIRRGQGLKPSDDPWDGLGPRKPIDVQTRRNATFDALANVFRNAK